MIDYLNKNASQKIEPFVGYIECTIIKHTNALLAIIYHYCDYLIDKNVVFHAGSLFKIGIYKY